VRTLISLWKIQPYCCDTANSFIRSALRCSKLNTSNQQGVERKTENH
jgi:hypothetical protein